MSVPEYQTSPTSSLLGVLAENHGFTSWFKFTGLEGYFPALGYALLLHNYMQYSGVWRWMDETYRKTIAPIIQVDEDGVARWPELQRFGEAEYWLALGNACKELCKQPFSDPVVKLDVINRLQAGRMLDFEDADHNASLAGYFNISLAMHRWVDSEPKTHHYCKASVGQVVVFVNLAFERDCVYSLIHANFQPSSIISEPVFPHYMLYAKKGSPLVFTPAVSQDVSQDSDHKDILIKNLALLVNLLAKEVVCLTTLPLSLQATHSQLYELQRQVAPLLQRHFPDSDINTEDMRKALALQVLPEEDTRPPHTYVTCGLYTEVQAEGMRDHGHFFHIPCLESHFLKVSRLDETLKCPIPFCPHYLPEQLLDRFPHYKQRYSAWKTQQLEYATTSKLRTLCSNCSINVSAERLCAVDQHRLCRECCMMTWNNRACIVCHKPLSSQARMTLDGFLKTTSSSLH